MVETRIANTNSPWLAGVKVGDIHTIPVSHGEGKFVVTTEEFAELRDNGQIFSQYVDFEGRPTWILNIIQMVLSMLLKVSQARTVKLLVRWDTQNVSKMVSSKIFLEIKNSTSLRQRLNTSLENNRASLAHSVMIFFAVAIFLENWRIL